MFTEELSGLKGGKGAAQVTQEPANVKAAGTSFDGESLVTNGLKHLLLGRVDLVAHDYLIRSLSTYLTAECTRAAARGDGNYNRS